MNVELAKGALAFVIVLNVLAVCVVLAVMAGDAESFKAWFEMPIRDAKIKDVAVLLIVAAFLAR